MTNLFDTDAASNLTEYTVSELSGSIKRTVETAFDQVRVRGEISGYRGPHSSGHAYFSLKDDRARIDAVVWKGTMSRLKVRPEEGMEVIATGKITTFPGSSKYQIVIESLEPAGAGALMALLEERRCKLAAEGLFDADRKRRLPFLPRVIGVVTSPTGAVIRDILHRISDRFPVHVLVWPVKVQGEGSGNEVANAIRGFNAMTPDGPIPRPDVLIVARGGGSLEDLWSFNDEIVVRAAAESAIPLISAVGHETDWTLIDHAADIREHSIKFASQNNKGHPQVMGMQKFADLVAQKSGNKIRVRLFPGGVLGGDLETVSSLQGGTIEMTVLNSGILQAQIKDFAAFDFPFLFNNDKEVDALVDGPFGQTLHKKLQDKGLVGLAYFDLGFRNITNGKHAINKPEDIAGLKLRVIQSPIYVDVFKALGANPTPLAWPEVYNALEQGAVDGQENPFTVILNAKLDEVQKYLAITRHIYNPQSVIISKKFWDSLNPDEQKLIQEAADEAAAYQRKVSRDAALTALETLKKHGMQVTELSPADLDKMREMVKPVVEKYTQEVGEDTIKSMYAEIDKIRKP